MGVGSLFQFGRTPMKLKLTKKSAMAEDTKSPTPGPVETQNQPVTNKLYKDDNGQRRMNTSMFEWQEVFSSTEKDTVDRARVEFGRKLISSFVVFDFDSSEFVLMT